MGELNEKFKFEYDKEYLRLVREYIINPQNAESLENVMNRIEMFLQYVMLNHDDNSQLLVVTHNGIMRIIKKYYMNKTINIDSENLGQFKLVLKNKRIGEKYESKYKNKNR